MDSTADTHNHMRQVQKYLNIVVNKLLHRGEVHDDSKLGSVEKPLFDRASNLKTLEYGSAAYNASLVELEIALAHHYQHNSHHPQHYPNGIAGMNIVDLVEMLCDWKAASERTEGGSLEKSIEINSNCFKMDPQLVAVFRNSIDLLKA